jgi:uncharacterized protein (TIGR02231 family)
MTAKTTPAILIVLLFSAPAMAADLTAQLPIDRVTVYAEGAQVTRAGNVSLTPGTQRIVVHGLPAELDKSLLQVTVGGTGIRLGSVDTDVVNEEHVVAARERELGDQIEHRSDLRAAIQDEIDTATTQLKLLDSLAANPTGGAYSQPAVNGTNLAAVVSTVGSSATATRTRLRDARIRLREADREIAKLQADLKKVATAAKSSLDVMINLEVPAAQSAPVSVSYRIGDAGWGWIYQARLDTASGKLELERQGGVTQSSGEDWSNVQLTLTTAQPSEDAATPVVESEYLDLQLPLPAAVAAAPALRAVGRARDERDALEEIAVTGQKRGANVSASQYLVEYTVPGRTTLSADSQPRLYPISTESFAARTLVRIVPRDSLRAHLEASFKYELDTPLEAGILQLYRDGAYVGSAMTEAFLPGADVRMPFGNDERIKVAVRDEAAKSDQSSLLSKIITRENRRRFDVTSYHADTVPVEIVDRIPVSKNADIKVEILKGSTEPTTRDLDGKAGVLLWKLDAPPRKTVSIRHWYTVRYPRDRVLDSSVGSGEQ